MKLDKATRRRAIIVLALAVVLGLFIWSNNHSLALQSGTADISTQEIPPPPSLDNQYIPYNPEILPTNPPLNISRTVNLAKGLPDREVMVYIVKRSNGSFEKYFISIHDEDTRTELGLKPGDEIVFSNPLVILQSTPQIEQIATPEPTMLETIFPSPTEILGVFASSTPYP